VPVEQFSQLLQRITSWKNKVRKRGSKGKEEGEKGGCTLIHKKRIPAVNIPPKVAISTNATRHANRTTSTGKYYFFKK